MKNPKHLNKFANKSKKKEKKNMHVTKPDYKSTKFKERNMTI